MKRLLIALVACAMLLLNPLFVGSAAAIVPHPVLLADAATEGAVDWIKKLEAEVLPQLENILTPEQRDQFKTAVGEGTSFRKAFKTLTLTPDQKTQLKGLLQSLPKKDAFAALTPDQKKQLFMKKKDFFKPTPEEISDKISTGMKMKGESMPEAIKDKLSGVMKNKEGFIPTPEEIGEKISAGMKMMKEKMSD